MPNYQNGKIYKIWSPSTELMYIGSTTQKLCSRFTAHKRNYKYYKNGKYHNVTSFQILEYEDARIDLITECPCDNREQLRQIEGHYIRDLDCVNKCIPGRTQTQYNQDNKEKILEQVKIYRQNNKENIKEYAKSYYQDNKEKIKEYKNQKFDCECGGKYTRDNKPRHERTNKHKKYLENL